MNNTHTVISSRKNSSRNYNKQSIDNQFFEILGDLRNSKISITPEQSKKLYKTLLQNEEKRIQNELQKSHTNVLANIANENAAKAAKRNAQVKRNRNTGRANEANVARARSKIYYL